MKDCANYYLVSSHDPCKGGNKCVGRRVGYVSRYGGDNYRCGSQFWSIKHVGFRVVFLTNSKWFPLEISKNPFEIVKILQVKISHGLCSRIVRHTGINSEPATMVLVGRD